MSEVVLTTRSKAPFRLGYYEAYETRSEAMWREWELKKKWNTARNKKVVSEFDQSKLKVLGL